MIRFNQQRSFLLIIILIITSFENCWSFSFFRSLSYFSSSNATTSSTLNATTISPSTKLSTTSVQTLHTITQPYLYQYHWIPGNNNSNGVLIKNGTITVKYNSLINGIDLHFNPFLNTSNYYIQPSIGSDSLIINKPFEIVIQNDKTMAHLIFDKAGRDITHCELFDLEKETLTKLPSNVAKRSLVVSHKTMLEAVRRCTNLALEKHSESNSKKLGNSLMPNGTNPTDSNESTESFSNLTMSMENDSTSNITTTKPNSFDFNVSHFFVFWKGIMPGTKWCGLGDLAKQYEDLGIKLDIDLCCRAHDHCPIRLKAFRMGYGVFNFSFYSRLHCDCDEDFYNCLKKSPNTYASMLGHFYFNVMKIQCLKEDASNGSIESTSSIPAVPSQIVCLKKKKNSLGTEDCVEQGIIVDSINRMKIVPFGRYF